MINGWRYPKYEYKYAIGGKTGYTHVAQNTLVTYGEKNGMELVCVIMKAAGPKQGRAKRIHGHDQIVELWI